jgi:hypothetical protein
MTHGITVTVREGEVNNKGININICAAGRNTLLQKKWWPDGSPRRGAETPRDGFLKVLSDVQ